MASPSASELEPIIRSAADSLGVTLAVLGGGVTESPLNVLRADVEYRIKALIEDAHKFTRHSHRKKLIAADINNALRMRNLEPLYGFGAPSIDATATVLEGAEGEQVYRLKDEEVNLDELINAPLPAVPLDVTYTVHWLAVEGVQPAIPQNPSRKPPSADRGAGEQPLVKHILSKSLQAYFDKMSSAILGTDPALRDEALHHLAIDTGISELMPYFVQMASERVTAGLGNLDLVGRMLAVLEALLNNPEVDVDPYVHQIMPTVLTCLVAKKLSPPDQDHWSLRRRAATLTARICREQNAKYPTLQPRTTKTLLRAFLDPQKPRTTHFGAVVGLGELGKEVVRVLVLPNVSAYGVTLREELPDPSNPGPDEKAFEAKMLFDAIVSVAGKVIKEELEIPPVPHDIPGHLRETYGDYFAPALYRAVQGDGDGDGDVIMMSNDLTQGTQGSGRYDSAQESLGWPHGASQGDVVMRTDASAEDLRQ